MGNQSTHSKPIEIPKSRATAYFDIFHKITTPIMLLDCKHMSLVDLNNSCSDLLGISREGLYLSTNTHEFWPQTQQYYQNKSSKKVLKTRIKESLKNKTKTKIIFECLHTKGSSIWVQFSVTKITIWKNPIFQIIMNKIPSPSGKIIKNDLKMGHFTISDQDFDN
ncbi:hypothetical protein M0812_25121 [Anaeramoeba flamelloides]|uniref:LOV domain-containing protein n=1 Tax=Anaeramoeba flamelloides TaxID=1746091 RepID=A0AAV7YMB2_9EUKA|nr:hypothetical protein M0812_25121 [Anaeramoeba flamelloides]